MKRLLVVLLILTVGLPAVAQTRMVLGANAGYGLEFITAQDTSLREIVTHLVQVGLYGDFGFLRAGIAYAFTPSKPLSVLIDGVQSAPGLSDGYWQMKMVQMTLLAKLPIPVGPVIVWPTAGLITTVGLYFDVDGDDSADSTYQDFYVAAGVGADIPMTAISFLTAEALFAYNLQSSAAWYFNSLSWFDFTIKVGAGVRL